MVLQIIGCVISMLLVMYLCYRGVPAFLAAPIAVIGICLSTGTSVMEGLFTTFAGGIGSLTTALILYTCVATMFAGFMQKTGSADSIANFLVKLIGAKHAPLCIILACGVLSLGGMGLGAMIIAFSIGQNLCKKANYSKNIILACVCSGSLFTCLPYMPTVNNLLGTTCFGYPASAGAVIGIIMALSTFIIASAVLEIYARIWQKKGIGFEGFSEAEQIRSEEDCPHIVIAVIPLIVTILLYNVLNWDVSACVFIGAVLVMILNYKQFSIKEWYNMGVTGLKDGIIPTATFAFMGAIGVVISSTPAYQNLLNVMVASDANPYLLTVLASNGVAFFIGAVTSTYGVIGSSMAPVLIQMTTTAGLSVANLQRVFIFGCAAFSAMPSGGGINSLCNMFKTPVKKAYPPVFFAQVIPLLITSFFVLVPLATLLN